MNLSHIQFETNKGVYNIPNRWELLSPELYLSVCRLLRRYQKGGISYRDLHLSYVIEFLGLDVKKIKDETALENLYLLSCQIDFILKNPNNVNNVFLAQLVPVLVVGEIKYPGYNILTEFDTLTCSMTAIQFVEAFELIGCSEDKLPLLAAILYLPGKYNSEAAHKFAEKLRNADPDILWAISFNFSAFVNYIFRRTHFNILRSEKKGKSASAYSIGMSESIYNLSEDGLGNVEVIEQMPVIKYLTILRKKLIESVKAMHESEMSDVQIADKTGIPREIIKQIL